MHYATAFVTDIISVGRERRSAGMDRRPVGVEIPLAGPVAPVPSSGRPALGSSKVMHQPSRRFSRAERIGCRRFSLRALVGRVRRATMRPGRLLSLAERIGGHQHRLPGRSCGEFERGDARRQEASGRGGSRRRWVFSPATLRWGQAARSAARAGGSWRSGAPPVGGLPAGRCAAEAGGCLVIDHHLEVLAVRGAAERIAPGR